MRRGLSYLGRHVLRERDVVGGEIDVEGDQRWAGGDEHGAPAGVDRLRAEVRLEAAAPQFLHPAPADLRSLAPVCELAVEEDGQPELVADQRACGERLRAGRA